MPHDRYPKPDRFAESLEERLRALPQPAVPAGLEARLLATIPAEPAMPRRRWVVRGGMLGALAAACLLAILAWHGQTDQARVSSRPTSKPVRNIARRPPVDSTDLAWLLSRRALDNPEPPAFAWPVRETTPIRLSTPIPPDLFD
jgi:hypothetical protein